MPAQWIVRSVDAIAIDQAGPRAGQEAVPHTVRASRQVRAVELPLAALVEHAEFDPLGNAGEQGQIHTIGINRRTER